MFWTVALAMSSFVAAMAGKSTPGMSDTRSAQHMTLAADSPQNTDSFERPSLFEAPIIWQTLTGFTVPTTDPYAEHACAPSSFMRVCTNGWNAPTCFSPLILNTSVELIRRGIGHTCAVDIQHCCRSFAQAPRDKDVISNSDYRTRCLVQVYAT